MMKIYRTQDKQLTRVDDMSEGGVDLPDQPHR